MSNVCALCLREGHNYKFSEFRRLSPVRHFSSCMSSLPYPIHGQCGIGGQSVLCPIFAVVDYNYLSLTLREYLEYLRARLNSTPTLYNQASVLWTIFAGFCEQPRYSTGLLMRKPCLDKMPLDSQFQPLTPQSRSRSLEILDSICDKSSSFLKALCDGHNASLNSCHILRTSNRLSDLRELFRAPVCETVLIALQLPTRPMRITKLAVDIEI